jgi:hypothetical protein
MKHKLLSPREYEPPRRRLTYQSAEPWISACKRKGCTRMYLLNPPVRKECPEMEVFEKKTRSRRRNQRLVGILPSPVSQSSGRRAKQRFRAPTYALKAFRGLKPDDPRLRSRTRLPVARLAIFWWGDKYKAELGVTVKVCRMGTCL